MNLPHRPTIGPEVWTDERCFITELVNDAAHPDASLARCRVLPGELTQKHSLNVNEWYVILSGHGQMHVGRLAPYAVAAGDCITIAAGQSQQIKNTSTDDLIFECLCMPRFTPDCYRSLE